MSIKVVLFDLDGTLLPMDQDVFVVKPNASVNLQGKQNIAKLPYDDALVYVIDIDHQKM